jgi:hypothetical protein
MVMNFVFFPQGIRSVITGGDAVMPCTSAPTDCR